MDRNPLTRQIQGEPVPEDFKIPTLDKYNDNSNPGDHLAHVVSVLQLYNYSDA